MNNIPEGRNSVISDFFDVSFPNKQTFRGQVHVTSICMEGPCLPSPPLVLDDEGRYRVIVSVYHLPN